VSLATLVDRSGLPRSTIHRTATQMVELGWLGRRNGYYHVGDRLFEVASLAPTRSELRDVVLPHVQDLHETSRSPSGTPSWPSRTAPTAWTPRSPVTARAQETAP
jgi:DNA-binding IclR family transcriptional regulator